MALTMDTATDEAKLRPAEPTVTIAIPMLNEAAFIVPCLDAFSAQNWPMEKLDLLVIDGGSADGSQLVVEAYAEKHPWVRLVDNEDGSASAAFNIGMHQANGEVVCLFSSHGVPDADYVRRSVEALHRSGAGGVGGTYRHEGLDPTSQAIGLAMVSPVGMASPHRYATEARDVDTISHPAYWRDAMLEVGGFDQSLMRNSDFEFNFRMREAGHRLHFDPAIGSVYRPRPNLNALFRQFWYYGKWKAKVVEQHPTSLEPRHAVAPAFTLGVMATPVAWRVRPLRPVIAAAYLAYAAVVAVGVRKAKPTEHNASVSTLAAAFPTMHLAWGAGFIKSTFERFTGGKDT